jgi:hypothetical protein
MFTFDINLCYTMILRRATEKDRKFKIWRERKREKIKNKEASETAEHLISTDAGWLLLGTFDIARNKPETKWVPPKKCKLTYYYGNHCMSILIKYKTTVTPKIIFFIIFGVIPLFYIWPTIISSSESQ